MSIQYQGQSMSVYRLAQLTGYPMTSLYRAYHKGLLTGRGYQTPSDLPRQGYERKTAMRRHRYQLPPSAKTP
ncbi:hypothetical protein [Vibrio sp. JZG120]